jgi:hypothetical protein
MLLLLLEFGYLFLINFHTENAMVQDLGRHLVIGKMIVNEKQFPLTNTFSYTYPEFPFINHHWGSEAIFYLVNKYFSMNGLIVMKILVTVTTIGVITIFTSLKTGVYSLPFIIYLALGIFSERTDTRPEIFGYLFFSITIVLLYRELEKYTRLVWTLPLVAFLWINLHISFVYCPVLYVLFILAISIKRRMKKKYIIIGIFILLALLINPGGIKGVIYPLQIFNNYGYPIVENQSPFFLEKLMDNPTIMYFKMTLGFLIIPLIFLLKNGNHFEAVTLVLMGIMSMQAIRNFPFFAISIIYPLSLGLLIVRKYISDVFKFPRGLLILLYFISLVILWCLTVIQVESLISNRNYDSRMSLEKTGFGIINGMQNTVDFYINHNLKGPIFNNFDIGSYLIYRLFPKERVFVDGRPEAYPAEFFKNVYIPMQEKEDLWERQNEKFKFNTIIFSHNDQTPWGKAYVKRIVKNQSWKLIYFDDVGMIMIKKDDVHSEGLDQKAIFTRAEYLLANAKRPGEIARLINFFNIIDAEDLVRKGFLRMGEIKGK